MKKVSISWRDRGYVAHLKTVRIKLKETGIQPPTAGFKASAGLLLTVQE